ncbi:fungal-specific transcription factor domain-containing protein [Mycena filopes]|nr:fungal-specific transcription factor domain-containing protein [Mycena filopes]
MSTKAKGPPKTKRQRACDICRRNKRKCDGGGERRCTRCTKYDLACTYAEPALRRVVPHTEDLSNSEDEDYVDALKLRLETAEAALKRQEEAQMGLAIRAIRSMARPFPAPHPDDAAFLEIADSLQAISLDDQPRDPGFLGKSSAAMLVKAAVAVKPPNKPWTPPQNRPPPRRWTLKPWEAETFFECGPFPDDALLASLVASYFSRVNHFLPLLHRGIFEESVHRRLYVQDPSFGTVLLLVCALGALYLPGSEGLAWELYNQVELCGHSLRQQPTLYDLQAYGLATEFLRCAVSARAAWSIVGFGVRMMQDVAAHRRKSRRNAISVEEELEKRAVWLLLLSDTYLSGILGRPPALDPLEIDIDLPSSCDDGFWEPSGPGVQPPDVPASAPFFSALLMLYRVLHFAQRSLYVTVVSHLRMGPAHLQTFAHIAAELNAALDWTFKTTIPPHLMWDPARQDALFFDQSAALYCFYCYTRILIFRPFIPALRSQVIPADPNALAICVRAARSCMHVAQIQWQRAPANPLPFSQGALFSSAMVLLLDRWSEGEGGQVQSEADAALIRAAIDILKSQRRCWASSGFYIDVLERLILLDEAPADVDMDTLIVSGDDNDMAMPVPSAASSSNSSTRQYNAIPATTPRPVPLPPAFVGDEEIRASRRIPRGI